MDYKIEYLPEANNQVPEEGYGQYLQRLGTGLGAKVLQGAEQLVNLPENISSAVLTPIVGKAAQYISGGQFNPEEFQRDIQGLMPKTAKEQISEKMPSNFPKDYLEPKGTLESIGHLFAESVPGIAGAPAKFGATLAGNSAQQFAKEYGFGPLMQLGFGLAGSAGYDALKKGNLSSLRKVASQERAKEKELVNKMAPKIIFNGKELESEYNNLVDQAKQSLTKEEFNKVYPELKRIDRIVQAGKGDAAKVWKEEKFFNSLWNDKATPRYQNIIRSASRILDSQMKKLSETHPDFGKHYNRYESLHKAIDAPGTIREFFENATNLNVIMPSLTAKAALLGAGALAGYGASGLIGAGKGALASIGSAYAGRTLMRAQEFMKQPAARELFYNVMDAAIKRDKQEVYNAASKFNNLALEFDKNNPTESEGQYTIESL